MDSPRLLAKVIELSSCLDCRGQDEADRRVWWLFLEIWGNYLVWLKRWACNRMIDNDKLIIFACQVLEYQPEPSNQWTTVGHLEKKRACHAVLSIGCKALLPSLQGCLEQDDLFVERQLLSSRLSWSTTFSSSSSCLSDCHIYAASIRRKKMSLTKVHLWWSSLQALRVVEAINNFFPWQSPFSLNRIWDNNNNRPISWW